MICDKVCTYYGTKQTEHLYLNSLLLQTLQFEIILIIIPVHIKNEINAVYEFPRVFFTTGPQKIFIHSSNRCRFGRHFENRVGA